MPGLRRLSENEQKKPGGRAGLPAVSNPQIRIRTETGLTTTPFKAISTVSAPPTARASPIKTDFTWKDNENSDSELAGLRLNKISTDPASGWKLMRFVFAAF
jgi:hypothetical protein